MQKMAANDVVAARLNVGWYTEPVQRLYAPGKSKLFPRSQVAAQLTVGWYESPVIKTAGNEILKDAVINCYFDDVDYMQCLENKKIKIIPALEITYEQYANAINTNNIVYLGGKRFEIDNSTLEDYCYVRLVDEFNWYTFTEPDAEHPVSVIEGYLDREPIVVEISDDLMIRYGVAGYNKLNEPYGYEPCGRKVVYTAEEYFPHFEEYEFANHYRATIRNGKLVILDVLYHP